MPEESLTLQKFLKLPRTGIVERVQQHNHPRLGIFVPDGNRRMTLAERGSFSSNNNFYQDYVELTTHYFRQNLEIFFSHGLTTLMVPLVSYSALNRSEKYLRNALLPGLKKIFKSPEWLAFYQKHDIRLGVYGNTTTLKSTACAEVADWIEDARNQTRAHQTHRLFLGFTTPRKMGSEICELAIEYYKEHGEIPDYQTQVKIYYGEPIPPADFFIMSTKFSGLGAAPPLITGENTQLYFLAAPGAWSLSEEVYRKILYDLLFCRTNGTQNEYNNPDVFSAQELQNFFKKNRNKVFGLGHRIGEVWVPEE